MTADQIADDLAVHFTAISQEYELGMYEKLRPAQLVFEQLEVYRKIKVAKKPNSTVPGDLPDLSRNLYLNLSSIVHSSIIKLLKQGYTQDNG